jgi:hypothetical protein
LALCSGENKEIDPKRRLSGFDDTQRNIIIRPSLPSKFGPPSSDDAFSGNAYKDDGDISSSYGAPRPSGPAPSSSYGAPDPSRYTTRYNETGYFYQRPQNHWGPLVSASPSYSHPWNSL